MPWFHSIGNNTNFSHLIPNLNNNVGTHPKMCLESHELKWNPWFTGMTENVVSQSNNRSFIDSHGCLIAKVETMVLLLLLPITE
jgi:hypothetical protein